VDEQYWKMSISDDAYESGKEIAAAPAAAIEGTVNGALNRFIGEHFKAAPGRLVDSTGKHSERFGCVVYRAEQNADPADRELISADSAAAVLDVSEELTLETLRASYRRIADAKTLRKSPVPRGEGRSNITLGIIVAVKANVSLETIGEEIERLNDELPSAQWPDMVVVAQTGTINYAVQFPGESISGDFLPPAEGALANYIPAIYVVPVMCPTGAHAFNKMLAFLIGHLVFFAPDVQFPDWSKFLEAVAKNVMTLGGYQYNLRGDLMPVPRDRYNGRIMPEVPIVIEDNRGRTLAAIKYVPWQDGGVVGLSGKLPLEGLLVFADKEALRKGGIIRRPHGTISHVLRMTRTDFDAMLDQLQRRSNMRVRHDAGRFIVQKIADEGTSSPFMARIFLGVLRLREGVYPDPSKREEFDRSYDYVTSALSSVRSSAQKIAALWEGHVRKVATGEIVRYQGAHIEITDNIDRELRSEIETFLNAAVRALKTGLQNLGKELGVNIGFLFQQPDTFERRVSELAKTDPALAEYLRQTRLWSEPLMKSRIDLEHGTWVLPRVAYQPSGTSMIAVEPMVAGQPISEFVRFSFDRLACFVEEFTCHCLQRRMPSGITIAEIPLSKRTAEAPERFRLTLAEGGLPAWRIEFHASKFEET
jgi:hypothetical protein